MPPKHHYAILCISENTETLTQLTNKLQQDHEKHISVQTSQSAIEALELLSEFEEDDIQLGIIIADQKLDEISGSELLKEAHKRHPNALKIMLAESLDIGTLVEAINHSRLFSLLEHPVEENNFLQVIERAKEHFYSEWQLRKENHQLKKQINQLEEKLSERTTELLKKNLQLQQLSTTDALTQLPNRLKLDEQFSQAIRQCKRYDTPLSVILMDLDHFKEVNDIFGHQIGDQVLIELANIMKSNVRETDMVGRWGGEEFLIICPNLDIEHGKLLAEKLRKLIYHHPFKTIEHKTASFGVAEYLEKDDEDSLLERADQALYRAKEKGRNRIEIG